MMPWGSYGWGMGLGSVFMVAFWIVVILGAVYLGKVVAGGERRTSGERALDILKKRYAKGEMSEEEFEKKKAIE